MKTIKSKTVTSKRKGRGLHVFRVEIGKWALLLPCVILMYILVWRPTVLGAAWSFFKMNVFTPQEFCGLDNYVKVLTHTRFLPTLWNTLQYVFWSLVIGYLPPIILAVMLNELVHFNSGFRVVTHLPVIIPGIAAMLMWYYIYYPDHTGLLNMILVRLGMEPYGWLNDPKFAIIGIVIYMTWKGFAGTMLLYLTSLQSVSVELYEAAVLDGAGIWKRAWNVTRPQIEGTMLLCFVQQIISVFQVMEQPLAMTGGGPNGASYSLGYQLYEYGFNSGGKGTGQAMALGTIIFLILLVMTIFYFWLNKRVEDRC